MARVKTTTAAPAAWQLSLPCTRAEAEAAQDGADEAFGALDSPPALSLSEPDPARPDAWRLDAVFDHAPGEAEIAAVLALLPGADARAVTIEPVADIDWVTQSQTGLDPIIAGRFHIVHDPAQPGLPGAVNILIPASRAFGTGQHETTAGCLAMLDGMARSGHRFANIADIGTGTGLLAFAAHALWPRARVLASDIDPVAIEVTAENSAANGVPLGACAGALVLVAAPGVDDPLIAGLAPYDLVVANILAGPLIALAPGIAAQIAPGGSLVLAGLLESQAERVIAAYRAQGLRLAKRTDKGEWPTLHLRKRRRFGWRRPMRWRRDAHGETPGYGSW